MAFASSSWYSQKSDERKYFQYERSPYASVSLTALNYQATDRVLSLAKPKIRKETTIREGFSRYISNPTFSGVTREAMRAKCTPRLTELSIPPKRDLYKYEAILPIHVPEAALKYSSTERINELAKPKKLPGVY